MVIGSDFLDCVQTVCEAYIDNGGVTYRSTTEYVLSEITRIRNEVQQANQPDK